MEQLEEKHPDISDPPMTLTDHDHPLAVNWEAPTALWEGIFSRAAILAW